MNSMGTFLSNKPLSSEDVKTNAQIGELLGFECGNKFDELDQENQITYTFEIIVTLKTGAEVNLITFVCRDMSTLPQNELLKNSIERLILADNNLKNVVEAVKLNITENKPLNYLISKLMDMNSDLDTSDIDEIINELNNVVAIESETLDIILPYLDMRNPVHVGIILAFLATLKHDPMSVFFPLQTTGRINEIKDIELLRAHTLSDILKQSSLDYQSFKRDR